MANRILIKRSFTTGSIPSTGSLEFGELALNIADRRIFIKSGSQIVPLNDTSNFVSSSAQVILLLSGSDLDVNSIKSNEYKINAGTFSMIMTGSITTGIFGATEYINPLISTIDYSGLTIEYMAQRPLASRMGIIMATWSGSNIVFTDVSSADLGDTSDISFAFLNVDDTFRLRATSAGSGSGAWTIQTLFKLFPNINS